MAEPPAARRPQHHALQGHATSKRATRHAAAGASKEPRQGTRAPGHVSMPDRFDQAAMAEYVRRSRAEQGLPPTISDPETLERVAALLADGFDYR